MITCGRMTLSAVSRNQHTLATMSSVATQAESTLVLEIITSVNRLLLNIVPSLYLVNLSIKYNHVFNFELYCYSANTDIVLFIFYYINVHSITMDFRVCNFSR